MIDVIHLSSKLVMINLDLSGRNYKLKSKLKKQTFGYPDYGENNF